MLLEQGDRFIVGIGAVLNGIDASLQRRHDAALAMRMPGYLPAHRMRRLDNRDQFIIRKLLF